jgi:hypothetical protein
MSTLNSAIIAVLVLGSCGPAAIYFADMAGIPDYGCNEDQKLGWTVLYVLTIFPAAAAFGWLALLIMFALS